MTNEQLHPFIWLDEFESIRSFHDDEVQTAISSLINDKSFLNLVEDFTAITAATLSYELSGIASVKAFQLWLNDRVLPRLKGNRLYSTVSGLDALKEDKAYIFISNHHDIIMDPLLINQALLAQQFKAAHCAIGDNLLNGETATLLAKLTNCFRVLRSLSSPRAMLQAMKIQSAYIAHLHFSGQQNIWIAQKEGRSKDKIDLTNPALIKMLGLARPKTAALEQYLHDLNIVPVAISYEWDPCDIDKSRQLAAETNKQPYLKSLQDDALAVKKSLFESNGRVHIAFGEAIGIHSSCLNHYDVANQIDRFVHSRSQLFPSHYAAYQKLHACLPSECEYSTEQLSDALKQLQSRIQAEPDDIQQLVYAAYAAPVSSKYAITS